MRVDGTLAARLEEHARETWLQRARSADLSSSSVVRPLIQHPPPRFHDADDDSDKLRAEAALGIPEGLLQRATPGAGAGAGAEVLEHGAPWNPHPGSLHLGGHHMPHPQVVIRPSPLLAWASGLCE
jgi:hypothetical protein